MIKVVSDRCVILLTWNYLSLLPWIPHTICLSTKIIEIQLASIGGGWANQYIKCLVFKKKAPRLQMWGGKDF